MSNSSADGKRAHHDHQERGATAWHSAGAARAADDTKGIWERKRAGGAISYGVNRWFDGCIVHLGNFWSKAEARKACDTFLALSADDKWARLAELKHAADDTKYICERKWASGAISYDVKLSAPESADRTGGRGVPDTVVICADTVVIRT